MDEQGYKEIFRFHKFPFLRTGLIGTSSTRGHRRILPKGNGVLQEAGEDARTYYQRKRLSWDSSTIDESNDSFGIVKR